MPSLGTWTPKIPNQRYPWLQVTEKSTQRSQRQELANFFCKGPETKYFTFAGHKVSVSSFLLQHSIICRYQVNNGYGRVPIKLCLHYQAVGWIWSLGHCLPFPTLNQKTSVPPITWSLEIGWFQVSCFWQVAVPSEHRFLPVHGSKMDATLKVSLPDSSSVKWRGEE
jgi:hypothetical protein